MTEHAAITALEPISRVVLLHNPRSGRGRSHHAAEDIRRTLRQAGIGIDDRPADASLTFAVLVQALRSAQALIVAGGDGSVSHAAAAAITADRPIYHYPLGTENLFARHFRFVAHPDALLRSLRKARVTRIDTGAAGSRPFVLMASVGFDAAVVARVANRRTAGVRRLDYFRHALAELTSHAATPLTIEVDGQPLATNEPGMVFVANSPEYAARLNPCRAARADDGRLDVLFLPYRSGARLVAWAASIAAGRHTRARGARSTIGRHIRIETTNPALPLQIDGEHVKPDPASPQSLICEVRPASLPVLLPA